MKAEEYKNIMQNEAARLVLAEQARQIAAARLDYVSAYNRGNQSAADFNMWLYNYGQKILTATLDSLGAARKYSDCEVLANKLIMDQLQKLEKQESLLKDFITD